MPNLVSREGGLVGSCYFCQKLSDTQGGMRRRIVVIKITTPRVATCRGVSVSPRFAHVAERPSKMSDLQFDQGEQIPCPQFLCIEETNEHCLDIGLHLTRFFGAW